MTCPQTARPAGQGVARSEDEVFWEARGRTVAPEEPLDSIFALLAFAVWMVWSVVVVQLPKVGFRFSTSQLFWLAALPGLSGATLRIFYLRLPKTPSAWMSLKVLHNLAQAVFNYPTLGEAYKYAAYDARERMKRAGMPGADTQPQLLLVPKGA